MTTNVAVGEGDSELALLMSLVVVDEGDALGDAACAAHPASATTHTTVNATRSGIVRQIECTT